ncbi:hypothetical protein LTS10_010012 [Elasticomyces elasticus]|nr:hypothetical protein LTS10_010012 [Elasticomyces elasticus]
MAYSNRRLGYRRDSSKHSAYLEEDDSAALDPAILETENMQSPNNAQFRKDSFATSSGVLSPAESHAWDHQVSAGLPTDPRLADTQGVYHDENNGFVRSHASHMHPHAHAYGQPSQGPPWPLEHGRDNYTPHHGVSYVPLAPHHEPAPYPHRIDGVHPSMSHPTMVPHPPPYHGSHGEPGFIPAPQVQTPVSPHSHQDWMGMAQQEMDNRPQSKRIRLNSPPTTMLDYARQDGIRKKNGRIDIPQERNIRTIDELLDRTSDQEQIKELKQQKRLLRNREAALSSRQRKKKHTEELEAREKNFGQTISMLEKDLSDLHIDRQHREEERQVLFHRYQESQRAIEGLQDEIRAMKIQHNEETSQLRRKVNILTDQMTFDQQAPAMSAAPSSTGFTDFNAEMEALNMGQHDWEDFFFVENMQTGSPEDFAFPSRHEPAKQSPVLEKRPSSSTIVPSPSRKQTEAITDQPIATGLLFMLLLCGAFVASKPASSRPADLPSMPPEVQAAAPTVLKDLLAEAGGAIQTSGPSRTLQYAGHEPQQSGAPRHLSRMEQMHNRLTAPTRQQEIDQAFSLTTAQYASISNMNYPGLDDRPGEAHQDAPPRPKRNLAEALANFQQDHQRSSKAEVYTRSLLWDQIPADTVRQFREIVRDHEEIEARQKQRNSCDYKVEA